MAAWTKEEISSAMCLLQRVGYKLFVSGYHHGSWISQFCVTNKPETAFFPNFDPLKYLFQKSGPVTFFPLLISIIIQKIRKIGPVVSEKNRQTNKQTNKHARNEADFIGPCSTKSRVQQGSICLENLEKVQPQNYPQQKRHISN